MDKQVDHDLRFDVSRALGQAWIQYRANIGKVLPFGLLVVIPPLGFLHSILTGLLLVILFEGWALLTLTEAVQRCNREEAPQLVSLVLDNGWRYFKNGIVLMIFLLPLLAVGFAALIIPSLMFWSFFLFSFHQVTTRNKFAIDACMESFRSGRGNRFLLFVLALFLYLAMAVFYLGAYLIFNERGWLAAVPAAFFVPYYVMIIEELFEQWETS